MSTGFSFFGPRRLGELGGWRSDWVWKQLQSAVFLARIEVKAWLVRSSKAAPIPATALNNT
jgi:hypothetical protein